ncbi:MAG: prepilin-type N-terminal cleavage/methylation domain-containing protein [Candidatus Pacebacteria bacterium]|nr:prepilin-type N-terminal cleavage/methylation domain-containing protein [Candidatus Paceibacterota bacterium]
MTKVKQEQTGFTLLELLVVIAIIGILASITIISYPTYANKARLANTLKFSDNVRGSLQQDMVAWWKFDETSGTVAKDSWWNQLNGTVSGTTWTTEGIKGGALSFDGNDYISVSNDSNLVNYTGLTLEVWIKPSSNGVYGGIFNKYYYPTCAVRQFLLRRESSNQIGFWMGYNNGASAYALYTPTTNPVLASDGWTHIVATWSGPLNTMKIYLNGKVMASYANALTWTTNNACNLEIGRYSSNYFIGLIDDVQIYSSALPVAIIQQRYADGLATHQNLAIK